MPPDKKIALSASALSVFRDCPRCFWLEHNGVRRRPDGIKSTLPNGIDAVLKKYFDGYRGRLPPELEGRVEGRLIDDQSLLDKWRERWNGLIYEDAFANARLKGLLDDCLVNNGVYTPLDYKTKGFTPKDDAHKWNQDQLNIYSLLLHSNGYPAADHGYLVFYHPVSVSPGGMFKFGITPRKVPTDKEAALKNPRPGTRTPPRL
ncbi:MAG: hypothetical protein HYT42_00540 [Candidatus Sungbacteria bacterium]|nr:hypothetical protein [Candidatus Sungbacteria bacterium]